MSHKNDIIQALIFLALYGRPPVPGGEQEDKETREKPPEKDKPLFKGFELGNLYITAGIKGVMERLHALTDRNETIRHAMCVFAQQSLGRHRSGDWGEMTAEDKEANDNAVHDGSRIFSSYTFATVGPAFASIMQQAGEAPDEKIWIITEADRSATTIMFPSEY